MTFSLERLKLFFCYFLCKNSYFCKHLIHEKCIDFTVFDFFCNFQQVMPINIVTHASLISTTSPCHTKAYELS